MIDIVQRDLLLRIAEDPRTHWKYSITAIRLLRTLIRRDSPLHASHVEYLLSQTHADHPSMRYVRFICAFYSADAKLDFSTHNGRL